jgi:uncharacterized protein YjcR
MHGGAKESGAPKGNQNAFNHGNYTAEAKQRNQAFKELIQQSMETMENL